MPENIALTEAVYYILLSLLSPLHGYGIMQNVASLSKSRVRLAAGTLYGALATMQDKGWIRALTGDKNSRKKEYEITDLGKTVLKQEWHRLYDLADTGKQLLEDI